VVPEKGIEPLTEPTKRRVFGYFVSV
jgi:hypothetical protein